MKRHRFFQAVLAVALGALCTLSAQAAPKVDPQLGLKLQAAKASDLFGVILTFRGERVTDSQVSRLQALGVAGGYRMQSLPVVAANATAAQLARLAGWDELRSIYLNAPVELYDHQSNPLIGTERLRGDTNVTTANGGLPVSGRGVTVAINDTGVDGTHQDLSYNLTNPAAGKTVQNLIINMCDRDGLIVRADSLGNLVKG